jgi:hypothetical protein
VSLLYCVSSVFYFCICFILLLRGPIFLTLPVRSDAGTELLANFSQTKVDHISDHIREWRHRKSLIKVPIPPAFLLEWFLKSLVPQLSKDVATSGVFSEEDAIMRAQQLDLIYSQSSLLYEILPDAPRLILDKTK